MLRRFRRNTFVRRLAANRLTQRLLRLFERIVPADAKIRESLLACSLDVVIVTPTNLRKGEEIEYVKAAKALNIPTVVPVHTWDNLTTKDLIHVAPDLTLVWNLAQLKEAVDIHGIPECQIVITGTPIMD